jgi:starch synthase
MKIFMLSFSGTITEIHYLTQLTDSLLKSGQISSISVVLPEYADAQELASNTHTSKFSFPLNLTKAMFRVLNPSLCRQLLQRINSINPDVVHIVFEYRVPSFFVRALHRKHPVVTTVHEPRATIHTPIRSIILNPIQNINTSLVVRYSDKIIVHGRNHKDYLVTRKVPEPKIEVIPHGSFAFFVPVNKAATRQGNILLFGKIAPYKGIDYLIRAVKRVTEKFPQVTVTIAGAGNFARYESLIKGDSHFIVDNRFIPDDEVAQLFQKAAIVVLPYADGSQTSIISIAGAFKKPVIATGVGNFPEMVEHGKTGFIVPARNADALAEAITKLLKDDKLRYEMGMNAYRMVREKFSWDDIALKTVNTYEQAIKSRQNSATA